MIGMRDGELSLERFRAFVEASQELHFAGGAEADGGVTGKKARRYGACPGNIPTAPATEHFSS